MATAFKRHDLHGKNHSQFMRDIISGAFIKITYAEYDDEDFTSEFIARDRNHAILHLDNMFRKKIDPYIDQYVLKYSSKPMTISDRVLLSKYLNAIYHIDVELAVNSLNEFWKGKEDHRIELEAVAMDKHSDLPNHIESNIDVVRTWAGRMVDEIKPNPRDSYTITPSSSTISQMYYKTI